MQNHSCQTALINLVDQWLHNINEDKISSALFVDFAKAFDVNDHDLLYRKLLLYEVSDQCHQLITSFLTNRNQVVLCGQIQVNYARNEIWCSTRFCVRSYSFLTLCKWSPITYSRYVWTFCVWWYNNLCKSPQPVESIQIAAKLFLTSLQNGLISITCLLIPTKRNSWL